MRIILRLGFITLVLFSKLSEAQSLTCVNLFKAVSIKNEAMFVAKTNPQAFLNERLNLTTASDRLRKKINKEINKIDPNQKIKTKKLAQLVDRVYELRYGPNFSDKMTSDAAAIRFLEQEITHYGLQLFYREKNTLVQPSLFNKYLSVIFNKKFFSIFFGATSVHQTLINGIPMIYFPMLAGRPHLPLSDFKFLVFYGTESPYSKLIIQKLTQKITDFKSKRQFNRRLNYLSIIASLSFLSYSYYDSHYSTEALKQKAEASLTAYDQVSNSIDKIIDEDRAAKNQNPNYTSNEDLLTKVDNLKYQGYLDKFFLEKDPTDEQQQQLCAKTPLATACKLFSK